MSTTVIIALGIGVLALLLVGLGWRIGRLGERVRTHRREHHHEPSDEGGAKARRSNQVVIQIGNHLRMTYRK